MEVGKGVVQVCQISFVIIAGGWDTRLLVARPSGVWADRSK